MKTKAEVLIAVADKTGISKEDVKQVLDAYTDLTLEALKSNGEAQVLLPGIGTLRKSYRAERQGRNPQTGEAMTIPAAYTPGLKFRKSFKDALNE